MFFIVNRTKRNIVISDLGLGLGPRQALDLDKMVGREKAERSQHLKGAVSKGVIDIKIKDDSYGTFKLVQPPPPPFPDIDVNIDEGRIQDAIAKGVTAGNQQIIDALKEGMQAKKTGSEVTTEDLFKMIKELKENQQPQQSVMTPEMMQQMMDKLADVIKQQQGNTVIINKGGGQDRDDEEVQVDEEKLVEIHSRVVDKKMKNINISDVNYEEKVVEDNMQSNIDELEDLLGA